mmetsp:Transcript_22681/g.64212  ORF Transcript_22681/g.64212 Transcript_22681/m.64212 type:complete len:698 (+) Transcript_22681:200-2293(+)
MKCFVAVFAAFLAAALPIGAEEAATAEASSSSSSTAAPDLDAAIPSEASDQCGYYLAVSSTSTTEAPRWGVYTGKHVAEGDAILHGDVAINIHNLIGNQLREDHETEETEQLQAFLEKTVDHLEQYVWVPQTVGAQYELAPELGKAVTAIPGPGVLASFHNKFTNADWSHAAAYFRTKWNEPVGVAHPGRGAYSAYYGATMVAQMDIKAGMEVFINYGDNWDDDEEDDDEKTLTAEDHEKVDKTIEKIIGFFDKHGAELDEPAKADIFNFLMVDVMSAAAGATKGKLIREVLPATIEELRRVPDAGGSLTWSQPSALRSLDWLAQYGLCMDNIQPGASTIPNAGRGAFATRGIAEGALVAPVPLVHIANEDILDMYPLVKAEGTDEDEWIRQEDSVIGIQLLMNYCYSHPSTSMIFFPVGHGAALINHSREKANAKLSWSKHPHHHQHWFDVPPFKLADEETSHLGLLMEVVALRPIEEGEEIFIDYGDEWVTAWEAHQASWKTMQQDGHIPTAWPVQALDLMEEHRDGAKPIKIPSENPDYPDNVMTKCFLIVKKPTDEPLVNSAGQKVRLWVNGTSTTTPFDSENLFQCTVDSRKESAEHHYLYDVIFRSQDDPTSVTVVRDVPHKAIVFVDRPGTGDQFRSYSFRHYIGIPDDVFPQGPWRDWGDDEDEGEYDGDDEDEDGGEDDEDGDFRSEL